MTFLPGPRKSGPGFSDRQLNIKAMSSISALCPQDINSVSLLGAEGDLKWSRDWRALTVHMPEEKPCDYACAFEIMLVQPDAGTGGRMR